MVARRDRRLHLFVVYVVGYGTKQHGKRAGVPSSLSREVSSAVHEDARMLVEQISATAEHVDWRVFPVHRFDHFLTHLLLASCRVSAASVLLWWWCATDGSCRGGMGRGMTLLLAVSVDRLLIF